MMAEVVICNPLRTPVQQTCLDENDVDDAINDLRRGLPRISPSTSEYRF